MRVLLTILAVALVTLLTAALIVPYFIDWSAHRGEIAERIEALTGGRVALTGPVTLRLLPTPYLEVGAGSATGAGAGAPTLTFAGARFELALVKLASGVLRFTDVRLERPILTLTRTSGGALALPAGATTSARGVGIDRFSVRDGTIRILGDGRAPAWTIRGVELDGDAPSLAGPYHLSGRIAGPGAPRSSLASFQRRRARRARRFASRSKGDRSGRRSISMGSSLFLDQRGRASQAR